MKSKKNNKYSHKTKVYLTFLKKVKEGKYTKVEVQTLKQGRRTEELQFFGDEEDYYYGIS